MDSDPSRLEKLIVQFKSNDIDVKVDALLKLQTLFDSNIQIDDPDTLINIFKSCLRTANQLLTTATLSALPSLLPLLITRPVNPHSFNAPSSQNVSSTSPMIIDAATLRQALNAFLPAGGLIERLGDKEKLQQKARDCLVTLGALAFRVGPSSSLTSKSINGKGPETPLMIFERYLKDSGLASKVWKVREQSILVLVHIRRAHSLFPIRPYLSLLVDCLEDTDPHVRDCARQSIVELFSGSGVTDAARADLKKEMSKKGVRKAIVDGVLAKLLNGATAASNSQSRECSDNGDASTPKEYIPPSLMLQGRWQRLNTCQNTNSQAGEHVRNTSQGSTKEGPSRPASRAAMVTPPPSASVNGDNADVQAVFVASSKDLENEFASMTKPFEGKESEHNWGTREQAIIRVRGMLKGGVYQRFPDTFIALLKDGFVQWSFKTLTSLRTTVSTNTCSLYCEMASVLGSAMDPFLDVLLVNLLKMASLTKKITAQQSQLCVTALLTHTSAPARIVIPLLWNTLQEKAIQPRIFTIGHIKLYIDIHGLRSKLPIESSGNLEVLERMIKKSLVDPNPSVKEGARAAFWSFNEIWEDRGSILMDSLDSVARKQLENACPNAEVVALPPTTPKTTKKSSVAAILAATRAKAKANATAPASLRNHASSNPYASSTRPGSPSSLHSSILRPISPLKMSTSTSGSAAPKPRVVSATMIRTASTPIIPSTVSSHSQMSSGGSKRALSPPSPEVSTYRRRISSSSATSSPNRSATIRRAVQTTLPNSPTDMSFPLSPTPRPATATVRKTPVPVPARQSSILPNVMDFQDESLLLAQTVPIPEGDTDSEVDQSVNLMSFSNSPVHQPSMPHISSPRQSLSPRSDESKPTASVSNALSSGSIPDAVPGQPVVIEDAMRARAEQAESAAERLLELVEPEDEDISSIPAALLVGGLNGHSAALKPKPSPLFRVHNNKPPTTPPSRNSAILRQAAQFKDSPAYNGKSTLLDVLHSHRKNETGWWAKRKMVLAKPTGKSNLRTELPLLVTAVEGGEFDLTILQELALACAENKVSCVSPTLSPMFDDPASPSPFGVSQSLPSLHADAWEKDKTFDRLFKALVQFLNTAANSESTDYGLILLWEMLENQAPYLEGKEAELFSALLRVRYCNRLEVLEATNMIRDYLTSKTEPVYGLTTMHASLRAFQSEHPQVAQEAVKANSYAFGLVALSKFVLQLPAEIAEEELPRLRQTLITALNDKSSLIVRESAAAAIIAAQLVLRDETHLFALLDGLADDKKNLLTYLFDKHGARGMSLSASLQGSVGINKLEKEIRRLDTRMSTPLQTPPDLTKP